MKELALAGAYVAMGVLCAVIELGRARDARRSPSTLTLLATALATLALWPLWAPFALAPSGRPRGRARRPQESFQARARAAIALIFRSKLAVPGDPKRKPSTLLRIVAMGTALALLPCALAGVLAVLAFRLSGWSALVGVGSCLLVAGLVGFTVGSRLARAILGLGLLFFLGPLLARAMVARGTDGFRLTTLPGDRGTRLVNTLFPERDGCLLAAGMLGSAGGLNDEEARDFGAILERAYGRIETSEWRMPTPAIATYLGLEAPTAFDAIVIEPPASLVELDPEHLDAERSRTSAALVFLHGYAGNFYVYCWELAQAAAAANLLTVCPSVDATGAWWSPRGDETLVATLGYLRRRGITRVYLAGLSNGAAGASVLALRHERELAGLVLISGMRAERPPKLPVLVVQGSRDRMMPAPYARAYAAHRANVRYHEVPGGHLVFLSKSELVRPEVARFLRSREAGE